MKAYTTKTGKTQYKPAIEEVTEMEEHGQGWCLACGNIQDYCEPDAERYKCEDCGEHKVYGAAQLALMGLVY